MSKKAKICKKQFVWRLVNFFQTVYENYSGPYQISMMELLKTVNYFWKKASLKMCGKFLNTPILPL